MNKTMMDILACPIDKYHPLELFEIRNTLDAVSEGALFCGKCSRFFPIVEDIPIMLPDELRDKSMEMEFLKKNKNLLPEKIVKEANPWHL